MSTAGSTTGPRKRRVFAPLRNPLFRALWLGTCVSNLGTWMHTVSGAWLMTTLAPDPLMVSLVETATTLPMFLLALPAGALADVVDRRRFLILTQTWMATSAALMGILTLSHQMTPVLLMLLTFCLGIGTALNSPGWHSVTPEIVSRRNLPGAVALNGLAINAARAVGPALGGLVLVAWGAGVAFLLNAVSFVGVIVMLVSWRRKKKRQNAPAERFFSALRVGIQHARHSPRLRTVLLRSSLFVAFSSSVWALLPLLVRQQYGRGPTTYGVLMAIFGVGAVSGATQLLPRLRESLRANQIVNGAWLVLSLSFVALALAPQALPVIPGVSMLIGGMSWLCILSSFHLAVQSVAPPWVRARAMSVYLLFFFGAACFGSTAWGLMASHVGLSDTMLASAGFLVLGLLLTARFELQSGEGLNLQPSGHWPEPEVQAYVPHDHGPVLVEVRYVIMPEVAPEFRAAMQELKVLRLQNGVLRWGLFVDMEAPTLYREVYLEESWSAHLRHHERVTVYETEVAERAYRYHSGPGLPEVRHLLYCDGVFPSTEYDLTVLLLREGPHATAIE